MREIDEVLRFELPPPLPGEGLLEEVADKDGRDDGGLDVDIDVGVVRDLTNGAKLCLAACNTRNFFKTWVSKREPS